MAAAKIFFHTNLRFLRERKRLSQEQVAQLLDLSRNKLQALESGKTVNPSVADMLKFSEYFKMSVDSLLKIDMRQLTELQLRNLEAGNDGYMTGSQLRILAITVNKDNKENMEYVPVKAKAGYQAGYNDPEFVAGLPRFTLPNLPANETFRMFPTQGDSMLPIPEGSDVIARFVQNWRSLKPQTLCIVILKAAQDFVFKQVTVEEDSLLLESLNPLYEPYQVPLANVMEIWAFHSYQAKDLPQTAGDMQTVLKLIREMQQDIRVLRTENKKADPRMGQPL
jgi:transcriptional regulator with XRE-family HTH domain